MLILKTCSYQTINNLAMLFLLTYCQYNIQSENRASLGAKNSRRRLKGKIKSIQICWTLVSKFAFTEFSRENANF